MMTEQLLVIEGLKEFTGKNALPVRSPGCPVRALTCRGISERRACQILGLSRRVSSYALRQPGKNQALGTRLVGATQDVPRFGYRRMAGHGRGVCAPALAQPGAAPAEEEATATALRLLCAVRPNSVWSYDFVHDQFVDGHLLKYCTCWTSTPERAALAGRDPGVVPAHAAPWAIDRQPRFTASGSTPITSPRDSLPEWLPVPYAGQVKNLNHRKLTPPVPGHFAMKF